MEISMFNAIHHLEKLYLSVTNDRKRIKMHLENKVLAPLSIAVQEQILDVTVQNQLCVKFPPPHSFKKMFLRSLIETVEGYSTEYSEELLKEYTAILSASSEDIISYHSYIINKYCTITLQENCCFVAKSTTGLQTWEASKYLSEWCIKNSSYFENKRILELGSGVGLLGITLLKLCNPTKYIFTDKSWEVLNVLSSNIRINNADSNNCEIQKTQLVWATTCENEAANLASDIILGADLVYDTSMVESLVHALMTFLSQSPKCAFIASTIRDPDTDKKFLLHLGLSGLQYEVIEAHDKSIFIYNPSSSFVLYKIKLQNT